MCIETFLEGYKYFVTLPIFLFVTVSCTCTHKNNSHIINTSRTHQQCAILSIHHYVNHSMKNKQTIKNLEKGNNKQAYL